MTGTVLQEPVSAGLGNGPECDGERRLGYLGGSIRSGGGNSSFRVATHHPGCDLLLSLRWLPEGFRDRLLSESRWSAAYADTVLLEYAKFIHLAHVVSGGTVPSRTVDAVWHLHLLFTESYWNVLCGEILGRPLHHRPGTGRKDESASFAYRYARTLSDYVREFGEEPPASVWPRPPEDAVDAVPTVCTKSGFFSRFILYFMDDGRKSA